MTPLAAKLRERIERDGPVTVAEWMTACLADPEHGYYMTRDPLGRAGDFITAPEISQMFGELLGLWAAVVWQLMGTPPQVRLVELGPGRGTLMSDALRAAAGVPAFLKAADVHMVETSPVLRAAQETALADAPVACAWHGTFADVPAGPVIVLANEFLDALPIRQLVRQGGEWRERRVDVAGNGFAFVDGEPVPDAPVPAGVADAPDGSVFEVSDAVRNAVDAIARRIGANGGAALLIDYGHDRQGTGDTLQAVRAHEFSDPLAAPGEADLTAHVDFGMVSAAATSAGARVWGALGQGDFLERLGIGARAAQLLAGANAAQAESIAAARHRLTGADAMGRLFRAVALTGPERPAPPGFETVNWA